MNIKIEKQELMKDNVSNGVKYLLTIDDDFKLWLTYPDLGDIQRAVEKAEKL